MSIPWNKIFRTGFIVALVTLGLGILLVCLDVLPTHPVTECRTSYPVDMGWQLVLFLGALVYCAVYTFIKVILNPER